MTTRDETMKIAPAEAQRIVSTLRRIANACSSEPESMRMHADILHAINAVLAAATFEGKPVAWWTRDGRLMSAGECVGAIHELPRTDGLLAAVIARGRDSAVTCASRAEAKERLLAGAEARGFVVVEDE